MTRAILAGIIATIVVSLILIAQDYFDLLPEFQLVEESQTLLATYGLPAESAVAWVFHAVVGAVIYGIIFAALEPILPGSGFTEGFVFGLLTWLVMMLVFMPLAGYGFFGVALGATVIIASLGLHLVYGIVLGISYKLLSEEDEW